MNYQQKSISQPKRFFIIMENMADDDLDPFEYRLLGHYKRVCFETKNHERSETVPETALACKLGRDKVTDARNGLEAKGFIRVAWPNGKQGSRSMARVTLIDIMDKNILRYTEKKIDRNIDQFEAIDRNIDQYGLDIGQFGRNIGQAEGENHDIESLDLIEEDSAQSPTSGDQADEEWAEKWEKSSLPLDDEQLHQPKDNNGPTRETHPLVGMILVRTGAQVLTEKQQEELERIQWYIHPDAHIPIESVPVLELYFVDTAYRTWTGLMDAEIKAQSQGHWRPSRSAYVKRLTNLSRFYQWRKYEAKDVPNPFAVTAEQVFIEQCRPESPQERLTIDEALNRMPEFSQKYWRELRANNEGSFLDKFYSAYGNGLVERRFTPDEFLQNMGDSPSVGYWRNLRHKLGEEAFLQELYHNHADQLVEWPDRPQGRWRMTVEQLYDLLPGIGNGWLSKEEILDSLYEQYPDQLIEREPQSD